jgi:hypothetical protein
MTCSMVKDLELKQPLTYGAFERGSRRGTGVEVVVKHENHTPIGPFKVREASCPL